MHITFFGKPGFAGRSPVARAPRREGVRRELALPRRPGGAPLHASSLPLKDPRKGAAGRAKFYWLSHPPRLVTHNIGEFFGFSKFQDGGCER